MSNRTRYRTWCPELIRLRSMPVSKWMSEETDEKRKQQWFCRQSTTLMLPTNQEIDGIIKRWVEKINKPSVERLYSENKGLRN